MRIWRKEEETQKGSAKTVYDSYNLCYNSQKVTCEVNDMEFSEKIKYVRDKLEMSQEDLARALNVSFASINRWENRKAKPIKIAQAAFDTFCKSHRITFDDTIKQSGNKGGW